MFQTTVPAGMATLSVLKIEKLLNLALPLAAIQLRKVVRTDADRLCSAFSLISFKENKYKQNGTGGGPGLL